jgi:serine/threonine protein kinase
LADFGLAKKRDPDALNNTHCGTNGYIAPEINPMSPTHHFGTDIWSLGMVLYEMMYRSKLELPLYFDYNSAPYFNGDWLD